SVVQRSAGLSKKQQLTGLFCEGELVTAAVVRFRRGLTMKSKLSAALVAAGCALALGIGGANATIVGSTYDFTTSTTGNVQISPLGGPTLHTDPANPGFCVGPPVACGAGSGVSGAFTFANVSPNLDTITFSFFGSTFDVAGSFSIDLGNFATTDGEVITGVTLFSGTFGTPSVSFNGTDAVFGFSTACGCNAMRGEGIVLWLSKQ